MSDPFDLADASPPDAPRDAAADRATPAMASRHLDGLNETQREAVEHTEGPLLVLAGAGTGKTKVLTSRIGHILIGRKAFPSQILSVTFTNKAAREMLDRVAGLIGRAADGLWLGTFHSVGARMLRRHAELVGLKPNFTILDTDDQIRLLKQLLEAEGIDDKKWPARVLVHTIQRWKDRGLTPDRISVEEGGDFADGRATSIYRQYQERLQQLNAADFGDLLLHCLTLFTQNAEVLADYHRRFRYILVDEYQDTNVAQYLWLRLLAQGNRNICCVGDDDQSIYGWRGAEVGNILRFEADFPGARIIRLERNYRSTPHILGAASGLIANNEGRLGKTLWTSAQEGERVNVRGVWDGDEEARAVGEEIEALQRKQHRLSDIAILVRAGFQTREFEERFIQLGLPYRVVGGPRFYERQEIRDALAYLRVTIQPDDDLAFERIYNTPRRGLGDSALKALRETARAQRISLTEAARRLIETDELKPRPRKSLTELINGFDRWRALIDGMPHAELTETVLEESGYVEMLQNDKSPEAPGRLENLKELVNAMQEFENLQGFLEHVSLVMENNENSSGDMVNIMTLHSAKGLEFDTVFLPGWEEGLFPNQRALDESGVAGLEEERRLAYVGLTRAKQRAFVSFAANRRIFNQWQSCIPSRFIQELPEAHVEMRSDAGLYGSYSAGHYGGLRESSASLDDWGWGGAKSGGGYGGGMAGRGPRRRSPMQLEAEVTASETEEVEYDLGERIFHQKFGYGRIAAIDGNKLDIEFDKAGRKKVLASFVARA